MSRAPIYVLALIIAFAIGTASVGYAVTHWLQIAGLKSGPWQRLATLGQTGSDPYSRANGYISGELLTGSAEGQIFSALTDSNGDTLDATCNYIVSGEIPAARLFTLRAQTMSGALISAERPLPFALHSDQILYEDSQFSINISATVQPNNWLSLKGDGPFNLIISYYDVAVINDDTGNSTRLPNIVKGACTDG